LSVQQALPSHAFGPALEHLDVDAVFTEIVKLKFDIVRGQEFPGLPAGIAALDSVND
jgi:hypothetical protein